MTPQNHSEGKELHTAPYSFRATEDHDLFIKRAMKKDRRSKTDFVRLAALERASRVLGEEIPS